MIKVEGFYPANKCKLTDFDGDALNEAEDPAAFQSCTGSTLPTGGKQEVNTEQIYK